MTDLDRVRPERPPQPDPLTDDELKTIVNLVVAYTRREPDTTMIEVWAAQSVVGRWTAPEAIRVIHQWAANRAPGDWLEPGDVTRAIRAERQDRALRAEAARLREPGDPATAQAVSDAVEQVTAALGWPDFGEDGGPTRRDVMQVSCPHCHAGPAERCVRASGGHRVPLKRAACHPARRAAVADGSAD